MNLQSLRQLWKTTHSWFVSAFAVTLTAAFFISAVHAQTSFPGAGFGPIPDQPDPNAPCQTPGPPLNVTFNVSGLTANVTRVEVDVTFSPAHTWAGDVVSTLIAPNNVRTLDLFGYTSATSATGSGDSSDLAGPYTFSDTATGGWWAAATAAGATAPIASGSYRTSQRGGTGSTGAATSLDTTFGGLTPAQANGTWTLRFTDGCNADTGGVSAATLRIFTGGGPGPVTPKPFFDFFGSGRTSFVTLNRPTGGTITWRILNNGGAGQEITQWGLSTDTIAVGYFDADNRADLNVYRRGNPQGTASNVYYIRQSSNNTLNAVYYGSGTGDFAGYEADYDGDGRTDPTVIRRSGTNWLWVWQSSSTGAVRQVPFGTQTGSQLTDDVPLSGADYNGDGRADLGVIRRDSAGNATYFIGDSNTGATILVQPWGNYNTDYIVIGDYLGDARADFAVWRGFGSSVDGRWYIRENGGNGTFVTQFGIPGTTASADIPVVGDYNGDGKSDIAVWRPTNQTFYWLNSPTNATSTLGFRQWGQAGDVPLGAFKVF